MTKIEYKDIIAFHPGYYLADIIEELEMTQEEFAKRLNISGKTVSTLLSGQSNITNDIAQKLSDMLGINVETFLELQKKYDEKLIEIERTKSMDSQIEIVKMIDYNYFIKNAFLPQASSLEEKVKNLKAFFKISDLRLYTEEKFMASFRTTVSNISVKNIVNSNAWLQTAIYVGADMEVDAFDEKKLKSYLSEIRSMTVKSPEAFMPRLREIFKSCGVAFVILPALKNCGVNGVVKWFDNRVVLAINDRFSYADAFWFTLFHEIKHVLQKKIKKIIVRGESENEEYKELEEDANKFASDKLIPPSDFEKFVKNNFFTNTSIINFAREQNIHPGIVVGRLQHEKIIPHSYFSDLKEKYKII